MKIRLAEPEDAAGILAIYAPVVRETAISFELEPPSEEEMRRRIASTLERRPWLVSETDGAASRASLEGKLRKGLRPNRFS